MQVAGLKKLKYYKNGDSMQLIESKFWWIFSVRGGLVFLFGLTALVLWPILEFAAMGFSFGVFILVQSVFGLITYLRIKGAYKALPLLAESVLGISIGAFLVLYPNVTVDIFLVSFVVGGIAAGVFRAIFSAPLFRTRRSFWIIMQIDILLLLFFFVFHLQAALDKHRIVWVLSIYFLVYGFLWIIFGVTLKVRSKSERMGSDRKRR